MNKKFLIIIATSLLISACGSKNGNNFIYVGPNPVDMDVFDYSNQSILGDTCSSLFTISGQDVSSSTLDSFLSALSANDYYANVATYSLINRVLYPSEADPNNVNSRTNGDLDYNKVDSFKRSSDSYGVSGTSLINDEKWVTNETDPTVLDHTNVTATGTYNLSISSENKTFNENYDYDIDSYDSAEEKTYNDLAFYKKTNLTKSAAIIQHFNDVIDFVKAQNEVLPSSQQYSQSIIAYRDSNSYEITLNATSSKTTTASDILEVKYFVDVKINEGMIIETTYRYSEIEKGSNDFILKYNQENYQYSHE